MRALARPVALAALALALMASSAAAPLARRRASDVSLKPPFYYQVQHLLYCANVTPAALPAGTAPACCTATPLDCAKRCLASPDCTAFRFAFYSDAPPDASDAPPGALPPGAAWQLCELHSWVEVSSCTTQFSLYLETANLGKYWWGYTPQPGAVYYDAYWRGVYPVQTEAWLPLNVSVSGPDAAALLADSAAQTAFAGAVVEAAQAVCCPAFATVLAVQSVTPSAVLVVLQVQAIMGRDNNAYLSAHIADVLASAEGEAALLSALRAGGFANTTSVAAGARSPTAQLCASPQKTTAGGVGSGYVAAVGLAAGLGGALLALLAAAAVLLRRYELPARRRRAPGARQGHDVFMSYRRADLAVTDAVHDKLVLAGLRVFYDRGGDLAGKPFASAIFAAIRAAPVVSVVLTLDMLRSWAAHDASQVDYVLAELVIAMHFARHGRVRLLYPLLVGEFRELAATAGGGERDYLPANPAFLQLRETLPAVLPSATLALVASLFAAAGEGETLDTVLAAATVRELILGRGDDQLVGVLEMTRCVLSGPEEMAGLVLRHRYAERIVAALAEQPPLPQRK